MPRTNSYRDDRDDRARAGADTLNRMEDRAMQERMLQYRISQDAEQSAYRAQRDQVEDKRYETEVGRQLAVDKLAADQKKLSAEGATLDNDVRRYHFEKEKALDTNAKLLRAELDQQAIEANKELRGFRMDSPDAAKKLGDWRVKYFRLLDDKLGDKRIQEQYDINQRFLDRITLEREKAAEAKRVREEKEAAKIPDMEKERSARLSHLESLRMKEKVDPDVKAYLDAEIQKARQPISTAAASAPNPNQAAMDWIEANPNDPRAAAIKAKLGIK